VLSRSLPLLVLAACTGAGAGATDSSGDTAENNGHPLAPDKYEDAWDIESTACPDTSDGEGATIYWAFEGSISDSGKITGEETWYWFFAADGWDADCADTFDISGKKATNPVSDDPCNSCDRSFTADMTLNEDKRGCTMVDGYESLLDNDDKDRIDEESYDLALLLDMDPLGGDEGEIQLWSYVQDDQGAGWIERSIGRGTFAPDDGEDTMGPGTLSWARSDGMCVHLKGG
jgi:hypothetical protein